MTDMRFTLLEDCFFTFKDPETGRTYNLCVRPTRSDYYPGSYEEPEDYDFESEIYGVIHYYDHTHALVVVTVSDEMHDRINDEFLTKYRG